MFAWEASQVDQAGSRNQERKRTGWWTDFEATWEGACREVVACTANGLVPDAWFQCRSKKEMARERGRERERGEIARGLFPQGVWPR